MGGVKGFLIEVAERHGLDLSDPADYARAEALAEMLMGAGYAAESRTFYRPGERVRTSGDAARIARPLLRDPGREQFVGLYLDTSGALLRSELVALGTLDSCLLHPRDVFRPAILHRAAFVVLAHNHPSGDPTPSDQDRDITRRLREAGRLLGIELLDHVVLGEGYCSLRVDGP